MYPGMGVGVGGGGEGVEGVGVGGGWRGWGRTWILARRSLASLLNL